MERLGFFASFLFCRVAPPIWGLDLGPDKPPERLDRKDLFWRWQTTKEKRKQASRLRFSDRGARVPSPRGDGCNFASSFHRQGPHLSTARRTHQLWRLKRSAKDEARGGINDLELDRGVAYYATLALFYAQVSVLARRTRYSIQRISTRCLLPKDEVVSLTCLRRGAVTVALGTECVARDYRPFQGSSRHLASGGRKGLRSGSKSNVPPSKKKKRKAEDRLPARGDPVRP